MPIVTVNLGFEQIKEAVEKLPIKQKVILTQELERETRKIRWNPFLNKIRDRVSKKSLSEKEITSLCEEVRTERYERNKSRR